MSKVNGRFLRYWREALGDSAADLAARLGIAESTLRNIEYEHQPASDELIVRMADTLGVKLGELVVPEPQRGDLLPRKETGWPAKQEPLPRNDSGDPEPSG